MARVIVLLNPNAGAEAEIDALRERLAGAAGLTWIESRRAGELALLAEETSAGGYDVIVAAGGDGTLNEVVTGALPHLDRVSIGLIPVGTGNDFARTLGLPLDSGEALDRLLSGALRPARLDLVRCRTESGDHLMVNAVNGGFGAIVGERTRPDLKDWLGKLAYVVSAGLSLGELVEHRLEIEGDEDGWTGAAWNFFVANGRSIGGGFTVAPDADPGDGLLDFSVMPALNGGTLAARIAALVADPAGGGAALFERGRGRRIRLSADPPMELNRDGDGAGRTPAEFEVLPGALPFLR